MLGKHGTKTAILEADRILQGTTGHTTAKIHIAARVNIQQNKSQMSAEFARQ
jgi:glycine/D-amino acid oxidase-like deaminating enzyme